jgi:hypothetical protein
VNAAGGRLGRGAASALLIASLALAAFLATAAPAAAQPRMLIAFIPTKPAPKLPLLYDLEERDFSYGLVSPTIGAYSKRQMLLDMSQGARIANRAYADKLGRLDLVQEGSKWRMEGWHAVAKRAKDSPGEVIPGLLADQVERHGGHVSYAGVVGFEQTEAAVAADRLGRMQRVSLGTIGTFAHRALALWNSTSLLVARFPPDDRGLEALDRIVSQMRPGDLIYVMRAPPPGRARFLPAGMIGSGFAGKVMYSPTTRRVGLVAATDVPVTTLHHLGIHIPKQMEGREITAQHDGSADDVRVQMGWVDVVLDRRGPALNMWFYSLLGLIAVLWLVRRRPGLHLALRIGFLSAMWLPGTALLTAALRPSKFSEPLIIGLGSLALGAVNDRFVRWPLAPAVPAAVVVVAHIVDLAFGSPLIGASIAGPNPLGGARFFGIGNELEIILALEVLLGLGAGLTVVPREWVPRGFAIGCLVAAAAIGSGRLGADVGGVITIGAGAAMAVLASLPGPLTRRRVVLAALVPVVAVVALVGLDLVTSGGAHLTRTVLHGNGVTGILDIVKRRLIISLGGLQKLKFGGLTLIGIVSLVWAVRNRERVFGGLRDQPAFEAGLWGAMGATVVGALANDSGPLIFVLGFIGLLLATGYVRGAPRKPA